MNKSHPRVVERVADGVMRAANDHELFFRSNVVAAVGTGGTAKVEGVAAIPGR